MQSDNKIVRFEKMPQNKRQAISLKVVESVLSYLQLFISPIIARRIVTALLIIADADSSTIAELGGLHERGLRDLKKQIASGDTDSLFEIKEGRGRKPKFKDIEAQILEEIEKGNYQTLQQISDMIYEKYGIKASIMAVSRFLKKTESES